MYGAFSNDKEAIKKVMDAFMNVTEFETSDGYYYDSNIKTLYIFEYFDFDCSLRERKSLYFL